MLASVGTSTDEFVHSGLPDGRTICGQVSKYDYEDASPANCPDCLRQVDALLRLEAMAQPERLEELLEEGVAWHRGLVR